MDFSDKLFANIFISICLISSYSHSNAQSDHRTGNWNTLILKGNIAPRLNLMGEGQVRNSAYDFKYNYFEVKTGISYDFTKNLTGLVGTGLYNTYSNGGLFQLPAVHKEFRTWMELYLKQMLNRFNFNQRLRIEQRFIDKNYLNRAKYRLGLIVPVNKTQLVQGSIFLAINDEVYLPQHGRVVEKNRFFAGAGYELNANISFQIGCINDTDYQSNGYSIKNYLQLTLMYDFTNLIRKHT